MPAMMSAGPGRKWLTTEPNPRPPGGRWHTHGMDQGQVGWRLHSVEAADSDSFEAIRSRPAACGLVPVHGWGMDFFIEDECKRCVAALACARGEAE